MVVSAAPGAGATTAAAAAAGYLARCGYKTCLVAADGTRDLELVSGREIGREPARWVPGLDLYAGDFRDALVSGRYEYVIADLGHLPWDEAARLPADLVLVVLPPPHRLDRVTAWKGGAAETRRALPRLRFAMLGRARRLDTLRQVWGAVFLSPRPYEEAALDVFPLPLAADEEDWPPGYRRPNPEFDAALAQLLSPVLPETPRRGLPIRAAAGKLAWPAVVALAGLGIWLARAEIAAALRRLFSF